MKLTKIASLILAIALVFSLGITAFAAESGSITINGISAGNTYEIYKLLDLESYDSVSGAYSYKVNSDWNAFFATPEALSYVAIDGNGYVTWTAAEDDDTVAAFAKKALAFAEANGIDPVKSSTVSGQFVVTGNSGVFSGLELGYYLIDSTMGALCGLTTTNPDASINAKNGAPTIDKQVQEDSTGQWGASNTAEVGQDINYRVTINVHQGAQNYVLHDTMSAGLSFNEGSVSIQHVVPGVKEEIVPITDYEVVTNGLGDTCTFEIRFLQSFCDKLETNDKVIISYSAKITEEAIVSYDTYTNNAILSYGVDHKTSEDSVTTKTFEFDIVKTDSQNNLIPGAEFKIYDAATDGNEVAVVKVNENTYRRALSTEAGESIVVTNDSGKGMIRVIGFDNGTYYLEETVSPAGYNKLTTRTKFIISDNDLNAIFNDGIYSTGSGVHVVNKTGSMLPETGGIGTTLFYVVGGILVAGSLVFLVTKKRMSNR